LIIRQLLFARGNQRIQLEWIIRATRWGFNTAAAVFQSSKDTLSLSGCSGTAMRRRHYSSPVCFADQVAGLRPQEPRVRIKRIYDPRARGDGTRILIERRWPRGLKKELADLDLWARDLAPSPELRKWFGHDPNRWRTFRRRYRLELRDRAAELSALKLRATKRPVTLLYGARNTQNNHAIVLAQAIVNARLPHDS
jgi:uncharacterized protein YeaO (DUF488 family)